jgi:N-acetylmuramoyl-L-alanine amidase
MRWNKPRFGLGAIALSCAIAISGVAPEQQLTVYTPQTSYSVPVVDRGGNAYIAVADLLSPLGVQPPRLKNKEWRIEFNKIDVRLAEGRDKATIRGQQADLGGKVLVESGRVLVPLDASLPLLTRLLNTAVSFHRPARRIFVGNTLTRFTAEFKNGDTPSLILSFTQSVTRLDMNHDEEQGALFTHTNRTTLVFRKDPVVSDVTKQQFGDGPIQSLTFAEENGTASLTITGNAPLTVTRSDDGKTLTLQAKAPLARATPLPDQQNPPASAPGPKHTSEFFVMIDPSHGGSDKGAGFGGNLVEKDITLRLARELREELEERGIAARLLRDSDIDVGLERRAEVSNEQHAGIYVAIHAGRPGKGVRVYTPLLADPQRSATERFLPWESAQSGALSRSQAAAQAVTEELRKKGLSVSSLGMPVRPLNNIVAPAIAVELIPDTEAPQSMESQKRQTTVAAAIASGIAQVRNQMGVRP